MPKDESLEDVGDRVAQQRLAQVLDAIGAYVQTGLPPEWRFVVILATPAAVAGAFNTAHTASIPREDLPKILRLLAEDIDPQRPRIIVAGSGKVQ